MSQPTIGPRFLGSLPWTDAAELIARARVALIPVGSLEQHGPHMALATDAVVAERFASLLSERLGPEAILLPGLSYGLSDQHESFPGTVSLRVDTFLALVRDLIAGVRRWGITHVVLVNGHGGNADALRLVSREVLRDHGTLVAALMWAQLASDVVAEIAPSGRHSHACEVETSLALALAPELVRLELAAPSSEIATGTGLADPMSDPPNARIDQAVPIEDWSVDGALGDPSKANRSDGERLLEVALERAEAFCMRFADRVPPNLTAGPVLARRT